MKPFDMPEGTDIAWCPGCGNYPLLTILKNALRELGKDPEEVVIASGIGQAAKMPQYVDAHMFNGLHGRSIPAAMGIKLANRNLTVIAESGDGDIYGEGGNHLLHVARRNPDITVLVHNNMVYGLTKGQASPTSEEGMKNPIQPDGVVVEPFNPIAVAVSMDIPFVGRANVGDPAQAKEVIKEAISFRGFSMVDIFAPCVVFNKQNTYQWFKEHTCPVPDDHDPSDRVAAFRLALETDMMPLGVLYRNDSRELYEDRLGITETPLHERTVSESAFSEMLAGYR
ncbi:MAG: 2-oxoacid ferredoxin oxidoreductase [Candidatus Moranbacteria bacterium]|nr:2-oxoacid ferredoxin oxidoreductase [Candidatus Moranbacteria bacterium]